MPPLYNKGNAAPQVVDLFSRTVRSLVIEITIVTGTAQYYLGNIRRLQDTLLQQITFPYNSNLTVTAGNVALVSQACIQGAYIKLLDKKGDAIIDTEPVLLWYMDTSISSTIKKGFANLDVDWEKSYIQFPSNTLPAANTGKVMQIVVDYCCQTDAQ